MTDVSLWHSHELLSDCILKAQTSFVNGCVFYVKVSFSCRPSERQHKACRGALCRVHKDPLINRHFPMGRIVAGGRVETVCDKSYAFTTRGADYVGCYSAIGGGRGGARDWRRTAPISARCRMD